MAKKQVAGYTLEKKIGKGSYATVWKGRGERQELVAIKVISRQTVTAQLRQEVEVLRKISHPNIVRFRDLKKSQAHFYLVLEYCAGGDLSQFLRAKGRVQEETARRFLTQIASGLFVLHSSNHLHRDLKPQNILLSDCSAEPVLKLADFGFARALPEQDMAATVCGSPLYMAPEILRHEPYDAKADLWSVGAILYELLLGRTPFSGSNPLQLLANIETTALSFEGVQLSAPGQQFLRALLVHSPSQRLSSQAFMQHPYVSLSPTVSLTGAVNYLKTTDTSKDQPSPVADVQDAEGSFIVTEWIDKVPKSGAASPSAFCSPEESPRDAEEAPGTGFITASSSAGSGYRGETGDTVKKVEELTASEVGASKDVPAAVGKVSPFLSEVINATARDTRKQAVGANQAELPEKKRSMDEDQYVVLASNTPTAFARGKGPTPAVAASSFCSNLNRIARTLEQLAMRLVEQAPVEALSLLLRALSLLEKALKVSLDDDQMGEPLRRDFTRTFAAAEKVERQLQAATCGEQFCGVAQPNRAIFESAVQHAKDAAVVLSKGQEAGGWEATCHEKLTLALLLLELLNSEADGEDLPAIAAYTAPIARLADEIERRLKTSASRSNRDSLAR